VTPIRLAQYLEDYLS